MKRVIGGPLLLVPLLGVLLASCSGSPLEPSAVLSPNVPLTFDGRCVLVQGSVNVSSRDVVFNVWDDALIDGDIISLIVNGRVILSQFTLDGPDNKKSVSARLDNNGYNYIILFAHNEGSVPPNTAALSISDGTSVRDLVISADLSTNGAYNIIVGVAPPAPVRAGC